MKDFYFGCYISIRYLCKMYIQFFASEKLKFISLISEFISLLVCRDINTEFKPSRTR